MSNIPDTAVKETWESVYAKSVELARVIEQHCRDTGEQFDAMVVVPRGSYYPANIVSRELGFGAPELLHACIGTYKDASTERTGQLTLGQMPTAEQVTGKNLLIIEEVCDKGFTLDYLVKYLKEKGASLVRTGVLHYKPGQSETGFKPDWFMGETDEWIVYPWEPNEEHGLTSKVKRQTV